jgi:hypothetical protein
MAVTFRVRPGWRDDFRRAADVWATATAVSLPWSTTATAIFLVFWLGCVAIVPPLTEIGRELRRARSWIGVAIIGALAVSVAWSSGTWSDVKAAFGAALKLAVIPVLVAHFRPRPREARIVLAAFLGSVCVVLALSWASVLWPAGPWRWMAAPGVPQKDYIAQNVFFVLAAFALGHFAWDKAAVGRPAVAAMLSGLAVLFLLNIVYVQAARTTFLVIPALVLLFVWQRTRAWKPIAAIAVALPVAAITVWTTSDHVRTRVQAAVTEVERYVAERAATSSGFRIEWYLRGAELLGAAPVTGYGVGGIRAAMTQAAERAGEGTQFVTRNPHNQLLWIGLQLGVGGIVLGVALWAAHGWAFRGRGLAAMIGLGLVAQNVMFSQLNSHLADYTAGWTYVVLAGTLFALADDEAASAGSRTLNSG